MSGMSIASHGRAGKVSAMSIASVGRLYRAIAGVVGVALREIMRLTSTITKIMSLDSDIN